MTTINIHDSAKVEDIVLAHCALHNFPQTDCCELDVAGIDQEGPDHDIVPGRP